MGNGTNELIIYLHIYIGVSQLNKIDVDILINKLS